MKMASSFYSTQLCDMFAYEILLQYYISSSEGNDISEELLEEFPELDFEFEASTTV